MKKILISILILLSIITLSCSDNPTKVDIANGDGNEIGKISFQVDMTQAPSDVVSLSGIITRGGYNSIPFNFVFDDTAQTASAQIDNIPAGEWNLTVDAFNYDSVAIYSGNTIVNVIPGVVTPVNLYLSPTTGSIIINVQWGNSKTLADLDDYLIGYWNFENDRLEDLSPYKNHGQVFGNASFERGKKGNAINFIGYDGFAQIPHDSIFSTEEKTISFWMYKNNDYILETVGKVDAEGIIGKAYDSGIRRDFTFAISSNKSKFNIYGTTGTEGDTLIVSGNVQAISPNIWYHCSLVIKEKSTEFYLNGLLTERSEKENLSVNTSAPIVLGKAFINSLSTRYFNGKIDEFRIYNKAFDSSEIQLLYYDAL